MPRKRLPRVRVCEWCGHLIGPDRGPAAKTCSEECQRDRNNDKEKKRYQKIKGTPEFKETRADYLQRLQVRKDRDAEMRERLRLAHLAALARYRTKLEQDPVRYEQYLAQKRAWSAEWLAAMTPVQREDRRAKNRAWYAQLTPEQRKLFFYDMRTRRMQERLKQAQNGAGERSTDAGPGPK